MRPKLIKLDGNQLRALSNPTRLEIHTQLRLEGPLTAKQLAARMDVDEMKLYYHLRLLAKNRLIQFTTRPTATKPEAVYSVPGRFLVQDADLNKALNRELQVKNIDSLLRAVSREQRKATESLRNDFYESAFIGRLAVRLNRKKTKELRAKLRQLS